MVFNTGAALLDAIVLAVVSREEEGTYGLQDYPGCAPGTGSFRIHPVSGSAAPSER